MHRIKICLYVDKLLNIFALSKREYFKITGRKPDGDIIAYQVRQSFKPGEITPEEANAVGYEFAKRFTKGNHAFIVSHIDKKHIHNHIIWNSTTLDCTRKFRDFWGMASAVRILSDIICFKHGLSIIENPKQHGKSYNSWLGDNKEKSNRDYLIEAIDKALAQKPKSYDEFFASLKQDGYTVVKGKHLTFSHPRQKQNIRVRSLKEYAELLSEKKANYAEYSALKKEVREMMPHKQNYEYIFGIENEKNEKSEREQNIEK